MNKVRQQMSQSDNENEAIQIATRYLRDSLSEVVPVFRPKDKVVSEKFDRCITAGILESLGVSHVKIEQLESQNRRIVEQLLRAYELLGKVCDSIPDEQKSDDLKNWVQEFMEE